MARDTIVVVRSDISGEVIPEGEGEAITFGFGKNSYSIDLTSAEADEFKKTMEKYTSVATQEVSKLPRAAASGPRSDKERLSAIRAWAVQKGIEVSSRGRISKSIQDQYDAEH